MLDVPPLHLPRLPAPASRRLAVRVTKDAERQIRGGHPWVFESSVTSVRGDGAPGDLAVVFDAKRSFVAIGLYDPTSPIRIRVLHQGAPQTIDDHWWADRIQAALDRRAPLAASDATTGYRCVHGENDGLPGLVLDRYDSTYVVRLDTPALVPHLGTVLDVVRSRLDPAAVVLRLGRQVQQALRRGVGVLFHGDFDDELHDGVTVLGDAPTQPVLFRENGLTFEADVVRGQKTGHFLDQRDNRARVRALAHDADVLDLFCCTGGFTVHAAAGGAQSVHSVDLSPHAIESVRRNLQHNSRLTPVRDCRHTATVGDAFETMQRLARDGSDFDLVVVDPPSFASKNVDVGPGLAAYRRLTELALQLLRPGGVLVQSSCSSRITAAQFHDAVESTARDSGVELDVFDRTDHPIDHPIGFAHGAYLKTTFARVTHAARPPRSASSRSASAPTVSPRAQSRRPTRTNR